jgi:D-alanine--D-alanine ligase
LRKRRLKVVALLDESTDLGLIAARKGTWLDWFDAGVIDTLRELGHTVSVIRFAPPYERAMAKVERARPDVVFNLVQAVFDDRGRDGHVATLLELAGIPYTGPGPRGLMLAGDKALTKAVLRAAGIDTPAFQVVTAEQRRVQPMPFRVLVKPVRGGGSDGLRPSSLLRGSKAMLRAARRAAREIGCPAICEEYIEGREITVAVIGTEEPQVLPPCEWHFGRGVRFVTERLKWDLAYSDRTGTRFAKAELAPALDRRIRDICRSAFVLLEQRDYCSIDLRVTAQGRIAVLEVNANPGLVPASERWKPIPFPDLIEGFVGNALCR